MTVWVVEVLVGSLEYVVGDVLTLMVVVGSGKGKKKVVVHMAAAVESSRDNPYCVRRLDCEHSTDE